jgi:hypothetical protein
VPIPDTHYTLVTDAFADGRVVPFLGAGASLCGRPKEAGFKKGVYLPSGSELARYLAATCAYPADEAKELLRVSQYAQVMLGLGPLYEKLHELLAEDYLVTPLHNFLAALPKAMRDRGHPNSHLLMVTTNYDDLLERGFLAAAEPVDVVSYVADGEQRGRFVHTSPDGASTLIDRPNEYTGVSVDRRSVILKIHGAVNRRDAGADSYVITEDHYIDYLTRTEISSLIPVTLAAKLKRSHFLFLGYSLADWNMRVILKRIWGNQKLTYKSWAVLKAPALLDQAIWRDRNVDTFDMDLADYVRVLEEKVRAMPSAEGVRP